MADSTTRRRRAARLGSETEQIVKESAAEGFIGSGILDLIAFGEVRFVVVNHQLKKIYIEQSFEPKLVTPELPVA